jgi:hypothetical protein
MTTHAVLNPYPNLHLNIGGSGYPKPGGGPAQNGKKEIRDKKLKRRKATWLKPLRRQRNGSDPRKPKGSGNG